MPVDPIEQLIRNKEFTRAFEAVVEAYSERLYWHIRRMLNSHEDADDVLQNTFIKIWKGIKNFRGDSKLYTWLYRIATNEALAHIRSRPGLHILNEDNASLAYHQLASDPYFDGESAAAKLSLAVNKLPEKQKLVFNMKYFEDMKYEEMAKILDTSVGALKASYHHAVKKIKEELGIN